MLWSIRNPWTDFEDMHREMNRMFGSLGERRRTGDYPPVNIRRNDHQAVLTAELPGMKPEDLDINVKHDTVTIRGERKEEQHDTQSYLKRERGYGSFSRSFAMPFKIEGDNVTATCKNGMLSLTLPRAESDMPKRISVNAG